MSGWAGLGLLAPSWFGYPGTRPLLIPVNHFAGTSSFIANLLENDLGFGILLSFAFLFLFFLLRILLRRNWAAAAVWALFLSTEILTSEAKWIDAPVALISAVLILFVLMRFGLLALIAGLVSAQILLDYPITYQTSAWYAGAGYAAVLVLLVISLYGFRISLGGRRLFDLSGEL